MTAQTLDLDFSIQILFWGYALTGDALEHSALIAEGSPSIDGRYWDRTAADLEPQRVAHGDEPYRRVRDYAALPWITEHCVRGHAEWPGL